MKGFCSKQKRWLIPAAVVSFTLQSATSFAVGYTSGWDCQIIIGSANRGSANRGDWSCRSSQTASHQQSLEDISVQRQRITGTFAWLNVRVPDLSRQVAKALPNTGPDNKEALGKRTVPDFASKPSTILQKTAKEDSTTGGYTVQWLLARSIEPVKRLQARLKLPRTRILQYQKYDANWYVLVQGQYRNKVDAQVALGKPGMRALSNALRPRVRKDASLNALGAIAWIPEEKKLKRFQQHLAKRSGKPAYRNSSQTGYVKRSIKLPKIKPERVAQNVARDNRRRTIAAPRLPVKPVPITPRISYVRKESVITQDYQAPVMAPRLPLSAPYPAANRNKPVTQFPQASMVASDLRQAAPGSHTIQWFAAETLLEARQFKAHYPALHNSLIVRTRNQGKNWYLVLQGIFRDGRSAMIALKQPDVSGTASTLSPWIRLVASLRKLQSVREKRNPPVVKTPQVINLPPSSLNIRKKTQFTAKRLQPEFLQAPENSFTIQWYAANDPYQVKKFLTRYPQLSKARMVYFKRNGLDWYVLVDGIFGSSHEALGFLKSDTWQPLASHLHPWTRSLRGLKKLAAREVRSR